MLEKAELLKQRMLRFAGENAEAWNTLSSKIKAGCAVVVFMVLKINKDCQVFCANGECAEPLVARMAKAWIPNPWLRHDTQCQEMETLLSLQAVLRCNVHTAIQSMGNALASDPQTHELI